MHEPLRAADEIEVIGAARRGQEIEAGRTIVSPEDGQTKVVMAQTYHRLYARLAVIRNRCRARGLYA